MTTTQLKYFIAAATLQSFTKAAEQFFITQTAMTQQIRALEKSVGCPLFDRTTRPISLTPAGDSFLRDAKAILERMEASIVRAREANTGLCGTIRIGYVRGYERSSLSEILRAFHNSYPNVLLSLYRNTTDALSTALVNQELDLIVTWDSTNLAAEDTVGSLILEEARLVAALYPGHSLSGRRSILRKDLKGEKLLYMSPSDSPDSYGDGVVMNLYHEAGFVPEIVFRSSDIESILIMVAAEEGISVLPDYSTRKLTNADNLVFIPMEGKAEVERITACWRRDNQNPVLQRLISHLEKESVSRRR